MKRFCILILCMQVLACGRGDQPTAIPPAGFKGSGLLRHAQDPAAIMPLSAIASWAGVPEDRILLSRRSLWTGPGAHYSWPNGKKRTLGGRHQIDAYDAIGIGGIREMSVTAFDQQYQHNQDIQHMVNDLAADSMKKADIIKAEAVYLSGYAQERTLEPVAQVGQKAYWEMPVQALHIYADGLALTITSNLEGNPAQNRARVIAFAQTVFTQQQ